MKWIISLTLILILFGCAITPETVKEVNDEKDYTFFVPLQDQNITCEYVNWFTNIPHLYGCSNGQQYYTNNFKEVYE